MKKIYWLAVILLIVSVILLLVSATRRHKGKSKETIAQESQAAAAKLLENRLEDQAKLVGVAKHAESNPSLGYYSDLALDTTKAPGDTAIMRYGSILFAGNSIFGNFKHDTAWKYMAQKYDIIDRGTTGSMWIDWYTHRDSMIYDYKPRQIIFYHMENEISEYVLTRPTWTVAQLIAADSIVIKQTVASFLKLYDDVRTQLPNVHITILSPNHCPWLVSMGMTRAIDSVAAAYRRRINQDIADNKKANYIETNGINDDQIYYRPDNLHILSPGNAYGRWASLLKPHFTKRVPQISRDTTTTNTVIAPLAPVQTLKKRGYS